MLGKRKACQLRDLYCFSESEDENFDIQKHFKNFGHQYKTWKHKKQTLINAL